MKKIGIKLSGFGIALPSQIIENEYFETLHNVPKGTIESMLGLRTRRHSTTETLAELAASALQNALDDAHCAYEDLDLVLSASVSISYLLPNNATMIAKQMDKGKSGVPCMDVNQSCLSWLAALEMAEALLQTSRYKRIAIVSAEQPSKALNTNNLETHSLFGDAAAAVIVEAHEDNSKGILKSQFRTYSDGWNLSLIPGGGTAKHPLHHTLDPVDHTFQMQNQRLLLYSFKCLKNFFNEFIDDTTPWESIDKIIPHQGSRAGLDFFTHEYGMAEKTIFNLPERGNCVAASIPLALCEAMKSGQIQRGEKVLLAGTAAGISVGGILIQL
jgi:3-oxoacyl-[acyl-carrier-protein] synthase-3